MGKLVFIDWKGKQRPRRDVIRELSAAGTPVAEIARLLGVRYQIVYMALHGSTPDTRTLSVTPRDSATTAEQHRVSSSGRLVFIEWKGQRRRRRDVIRELSSAGTPGAQIARLLGIPYQTVYQALHGLVVSGRALHVRPRDLTPTGEPERPDAIVVGCVKSKHESPMAAKDLYTSELFRRRRLWAEASRVPWWIFSSEYGLVSPDEVIAPYDTQIGRLPPARQARLGESVAEGLDAALGGLHGKVIELHAGDAYAVAVRPALQRRGARLSRPLEGLAFGEQLRWYGDHLGLERRKQTGRPAVSRRVVASRQLVGDARGLSPAITKALHVLPARPLRSPGGACCWLGGDA